MTPELRKFAVTAHVTSSVGWVGAVAGFLALAVAGLTSQDPERVRRISLTIHAAVGLVVLLVNVGLGV